jgi:hypothetical protein
MLKNVDKVIFSKRIFEQCLILFYPVLNLYSSGTKSKLDKGLHSFVTPFCRIISFTY